jgi:CheY-like chemotaxis protein
MSTVLVVDDDEDLVEAYKLAITQRGHQVQVAYSAQQARDILQQHGPPDAIVLDVMMETQFSGLALAREVHQQCPDSPIIMLTGVHQVVDRALRFEPDETWLPVVKFLDKPVDPAVLAKVLEDLLAK